MCDRAACPPADAADAAADAADADDADDADDVAQYHDDVLRLMMVNVHAPRYLHYSYDLLPSVVPLTPPPSRSRELRPQVQRP